MGIRVEEKIQIFGPPPGATVPQIHLKNKASSANTRLPKKSATAIAVAASWIGHQETPWPLVRLPYRMARSFTRSSEHELCKRLAYFFFCPLTTAAGPGITVTVPPAFSILSFAAALKR